MKGRYQHLYRAAEELVDTAYRQRGQLRMMEIGVWAGKHARQAIRAFRRQCRIFDKIERRKKEAKPAPSVIQVDTKSLIMERKRQAREAERRRGRVIYYGFDLFEDFDGRKQHAHEFNKETRSPSMESVRKLLQDSGAEVQLYKGDTRRTLPQIIPTLPSMDLIFIDGGHSVRTIANDWDWCCQLMSQYTIMLLDDYYPDRSDRGARFLVEKLKQDPRYIVRVLEPIDRYENNLQVQFVEIRLRPRAA